MAIQTVIQDANETAQARADATVSSEGYTAPDVSKIEAPAQRLTMPESPSIGGIEQFTSITPEMLQQQRELNQAQSEQGDTLGDIYSGLTDIGTKGARTVEAERKAGIPDLQTGLTEIENEIASKSLAFRREREKIEQGTGITVAQKNQSLSQVSRVQNRELADLEVIRAARSNTLTNAQNLINRQIELEFGDKIAQVEALKFIYDENKETLTKAEDKLFQQVIKREERAFELEADDYKTFLQEKSKYLQNAAQAGADNNTLKAIQGTTNRDELYGMDGIQQYAMSQAERLDMAYKRAQIANIYDTINNRGVDEYNKRLQEAEEEQEEARGASEKSLAVAALALELQTAEGLDAAVGFGVKKSRGARVTAGAGVGAAAGAFFGPVGAGIGALAGGAAGFFTSPEAVAGTSRADYEAKADRLVSLLTVDNLKLMSGVLSDTDIRILENAGSTLANRNITEDEWVQELQRVEEVSQRAVKQAGQKYGLDEDQQEFWGYTADGTPRGTEFQVDESGNIILPNGTDSTSIISNEQFWSR